jgi:hypothetical protein
LEAERDEEMVFRKEDAIYDVRMKMLYIYQWFPKYGARPPWGRKRCVGENKGTEFAFSNFQ